jgi:exopolyphosphatase / guanosine-5'-triphosphate,3'-diphosphate pyrophosphatase
VREQLDREPTTPFTVVARCAEDHPLVIRNHPLDAAGRPFPTLYWLTCPVAVRAVSRLESAGAIRELDARAQVDLEFGAALGGAHRAYAQERAGLVPEAADWGGVGGTRRGLKCLHAHYAYHLAGGEDPAGAWTAEQVEPVHAPARSRVAAVDLGTNSCRLLVTEPRDGRLVELARDMVITRLGQGIDHTGRIDPDALERTMAVLARYGRRARALRAQRIRVGATSAVRDASNRDELATAVREQAGAEVEVIPGEQEAALSFLGAVTGLDRPGPFLVVDIGGGSTELAVGREAPEAAVSLQMGSVRLTERVIRHDPPTPEELAGLAMEAEEVLAGAGGLGRAEEARTMVAVAGTATTVAAVALGLDAYDPEAVHGTVLSVERVQAVLDDLASKTTAARAALPVMPPGREDVIVAGATILVTVMRHFSFAETVVSEADILDGLALAMLGAHPAVAAPQTGPTR